MKHIINMCVKSNHPMAGGACALLKLTPVSGYLPQGIKAGQFVQVEVDGSKQTFLRRPISVNMADYESNELWLLIRRAGHGTERLADSKRGDIINMILPLGHGFTIPEHTDGILLVGGGVGTAPLLYLGKAMKEAGKNIQFAIGARSAKDLLLIEELEEYGQVHIATEDGSRGIKGFVTQHPMFEGNISWISCCGPTPMMKAVAKIAKERGIECEVSLENMMACGLGACLCCVEDTNDGHVCVCTEGPVFNINQLKWQN